ncbi:12522_t:CDS:2 [Entrophospora sp. SA101]|nr:12522_t:CDS:2 [Entrophospora sp. SA101]
MSSTPPEEDDGLGNHQTLEAVVELETIPVHSYLESVSGVTIASMDVGLVDSTLCKVQHVSH